jgi:hypothetical protein
MIEDDDIRHLFLRYHSLPKLFSKPHRPSTSRDCIIRGISLLSEALCCTASLLVGCS